MLIYSDYDFPIVYIHIITYVIYLSCCITLPDKYLYLILQQLCLKQKLHILFTKAGSE